MLDFEIQLTPYLGRKLKCQGSEPLGRQFLFDAREHTVVPAETVDYLQEEVHMVAGVLTHKYPDRALLFASPTCAAYCRFCTRKRKVGTGEMPSKQQYEDAFAYLRSNPQIHDVLVSGGDFLLQSADWHRYILSNLDSIDSVKVVRIGTRLPAVAPELVTHSLVNTLYAYSKLKYINVHFNHPSELTREAARAVDKLRSLDVSLGNQSVLLKGVNDNVVTMKELCLGLYHLGIRPYYIYLMDLVPGGSHFRTTIAQGQEIMRGLRGHISGLAVPTFVFDTPIGKIPVAKDNYTLDENGVYTFTNFKGQTFVYNEKDALEPTEV